MHSTIVPSVFLLLLTARLGLLLISVAKILFADVWSLAPTDRHLTPILVGVALLVVSSLYFRYRNKILRYL